LTSDRATDKLSALTALRFFAALLVFIQHAVPIMAAFSCGYAGVTFFFVLSGFILTYVYSETLGRSTSRAELVSFAVARFARIYPIHIVGVLLALGMFVHFGGGLWTGETRGVRLAEVLAQIALVQSWFPDMRIHYGLNAPSWSISNEAFFYACFPFLVLLGGQLLKSRTERDILKVAAVVMLSPLLVLFYVHVDPWWVYVFPPVRLVDFVLGVLLGLAFLRRNDWPKLLRAGSVELLALFGFVFAMCVSLHAPAPLCAAAIFLPGSAIVIYTFAHQAGPISGFLSKRVFLELGEASFAFYLTHGSVLWAVDLALPHVWAFERVGLSFIATLALSFGLLHALEKPCRIRIRNALSVVGAVGLVNAAGRRTSKAPLGRSSTRSANE
jgi:peptidoglycan/LPS O-acetylase OafA/YrhL